MRRYEGRDRMDRATAEQFLQGDPATPSSGHRRLAELLTAASAPAHPAELAGESAATAAFTAARQSPPSPTRSPSMIQLTLAKLLTVKVAAIAAGVAFAGVGGVALAAGTGVLPAPISSHLPGAHTSRSPHPDPSGSALPRPSGSAAEANLAALCREFDGRGDRAHQSRALEEQHFGELVRQAGKKDHDRVEKFCAKFKPSRSPGVLPNDSAVPTGSAVPDGDTSPGAQPSTRPSEDPSLRPGGETGHPGDRPSSFPSDSAAPKPRSQG
jgi:hypothetical protein